MLTRRARVRSRPAGGWLSSFTASRSGVAALEFTLVVPFLIILFAGGFEVARYVKTVRQITYASTAIASMIAQNTSGTIVDQDLQFFRDSTMITYPDVLTNAYSAGKTWSDDIAITISLVQFTPQPSGCSSNCKYTATVAWSEGASLRPCSTPLTAAPDGAPPSTTTLPADAFGPGVLVVVDIVYNYRPAVAGWLLGTMRIVRSYYLQPRYVSNIAYGQPGTGLAEVCS